MGSEIEIPILDFSVSNGLTLEVGSEGWKEMCKKVREALENYGCFLLRCDEITNELREEFFEGMKSLFDLPEDTKRKFFSPTAYRGYTTMNNIFPHSETFGIDNGLNPDTSTHDFLNLMWPQGNPTFSKALKFITSKSRELSLLIVKMVVEGFGLPKQYSLDVEELNSYNGIRMTKYGVFEDTKNDDVGLIPHTDRGTIALICDNEVQGLQLLLKSNKWVDINIPPNGFVVLVGDILQAWSNGRIQAATHRVLTREKERSAFVYFAVPKKDMVIKGPSELVDDENHPRRYRDFVYDEYIKYQFPTDVQKKTDMQKGALEKFAGL